MRNSSALPVICFSNFALLFALIALFPSFCRAGTWVAFGPKTYTRATGAPVTVTDTFSLHNPAAQYMLKVSNSALRDGGAVLVNGVRVIGPHSFNHHVSEVDLPVSLLPFNTISVRLNGKPGGALTIEITGVDNDPPAIVGRVSPPPDAGGYNSSPAKVTFACADALSGIASCSPPIAVTKEGSTTVTGTATDLAGNTASVSVTVNISLSFFKIRSWQTNPPGDPLQTGKCLDYGVSPSGNGASVFLSDCANAHPIRVWEVVTCVPDPNNPGNSICGPRTGNGIDTATGQQIVLHHEVMLFAGSKVIAIHNPPANSLGGPSPAASTTTASEFKLELQIPWTSPHATVLTSSPANQIFALDGDSIILEGSRPCVNSASNLCLPAPLPQLVIQVQNARGANGSPLVAGVRNLADNEFWDFNATDGSGNDPTKGFNRVSTSDGLWNALCASPKAKPGVDPPMIDDPNQPDDNTPLVACSQLSEGWGSVVVLSSPADCNPVPGPETGQTQDIGGCINLSNFPRLFLTSGMTLRGNRRGTDFGPQLYLAATDSSNEVLLEVLGDYVRVTGLRLRGQSRSTDRMEPGTQAIAVGTPGPSSGPLFSVQTLTQFIATIDHNDGSDWGAAAVQVNGPYYLNSKGDICGITFMSELFTETCTSSIRNPAMGNLVPVADDPTTLANTWVARNFLHHNERNDDGYGVGVGRALIAGNTFLMNRHSIAAGGEPHDEYRASNNLVLSGKPGYQTCFIICVTLYDQDFDMHGTNKGYGGMGGFYVDIVGNTFLGTNRQNYWLRGDPVFFTDFHRNVSQRSQNDAVQFRGCSPGTVFCGNTSYPFNVFDNQFQASDPTTRFGPASLGVGDFDGDGDDDLFLATGASWYYSPAGAREWRFLNAAHETMDELLFGDFDGDGRTDVVTIKNGQLLVSWGGISSWEVLNSNGLQCSSIADMAVGKFLDHPAGDRRDDIFCANGLTWFLSFGGSGPFNFAVNRAESSRVKDLRFADFRAHGKTDVFGVGNGVWQVSFAQSGDPALSNWTPLPVSLTNTVDGLYVADFKGDGTVAVVTYDGCEFQSTSWCIWRQGSQGWQYFALDRFGSSDAGDFGTSVAGFGHFLGRLDANGQRLPADLLLWAGTEFWISVGATTTPKPHSTQDMR